MLVHPHDPEEGRVDPHDEAVTDGGFPLDGGFDDGAEGGRTHRRGETDGTDGEGRGLLGTHVAVRCGGLEKSTDG